MKNIISATVLSALFMFNAQAADTMDKTHEVKGSMSSAHDKMCKNAMDKEKMEKEHMSKTDGMKNDHMGKKDNMSQ
ncbi:hypothetical protein MLF40_22540 [Escherichia coli]|nr:hypothetical protein [Escherichia coli]